MTTETHPPTEILPHNSSCVAPFSIKPNITNNNTNNTKNNNTNNSISNNTNNKTINNDATNKEKEFVGRFEVDGGGRGRVGHEMTSDGDEDDDDGSDYYVMASTNIADDDNSNGDGCCSGGGGSDGGDNNNNDGDGGGNDDGGDGGNDDGGDDTNDSEVDRKDGVLVVEERHGTPLNCADKDSEYFSDNKNNNNNNNNENNNNINDINTNAPATNDGSNGGVRKDGGVMEGNRLMKENGVMEEGGMDGRSGLHELSFYSYSKALCNGIYGNLSTIVDNCCNYPPNHVGVLSLGGF